MRFARVLTMLLAVASIAPVASSAEVTILVVAGSTAGAQGAHFRTELQLLNASSQPASGKIVFHPQGVAGSAADPSVAYSLAPNETKSFADVVDAAGASGLGSIDIVVATGALPVGVARAYDDQGSGGSKGVTIPLSRPAEAISQGQMVTLVVPPNPFKARFNIGVRTLGAGAKVRYFLFTQDGGTRLEVTRTYAADYFEQLVAGALLGEQPEANESVGIVVDEGSAFFYSTMTDNLTNDPSIQLPGRKNLVPTVAPVEVAGLPGMSETVRFAAEDSAGEELLFSMAKGPEHGTVGEIHRVGRVASAGATDTTEAEVDYTPEPGFEGTDGFLIRVDDENGGFGFGQMTVRLTGKRNAPPEASDVTVTTDEDVEVEIPLPGSDPDGDALTWAVLRHPHHGSVFLDGAIALYAPAPDFDGTDTFPYEVRDGNGGVARANVTIGVMPVSDTPVVAADFYSTPEDVPLSVEAPGVLANDRDADGDPLTAVLVSGPAHGSLTLAPAGGFTYTPNANVHGTDSFTYRATDGVLSTDPVTVTITVRAVNDTPSFTKGADRTVLEDAAPQTVTGWATAIAAGPADESSQSVWFVVEANSNAALFSAVPAVAADGTLTFTPAANANGAATITLRAMDSGGTADGGVDASAPQTFTISVVAVNDPPSFTKGADQSVFEDAGSQSFSAWATAISRGPADEADQTLSFNVTENTNAALFAVAPAIAATGNLTFTPAPDIFGSATITVVLQDSGGTADGGADTSASQTFVINVTNVNDAPSFTKGPDQTLLEDAPAQTIAKWATSISAGPNEATQTIEFNVTNTNDGLFSLQPAVAPDGTLTYTLAPDANGSATVSVTLRDGGGTENGGVDSSIAETFAITVTAVNDAPAFVRGPNQTVLEDSGPRMVTAWATGISAGSVDESSQTLAFLVTGNTNPALFSSGPAITPLGDLTFAPAPEMSGSATITVVLQDSGGTADGGADTSASQTFDITVTGVNDAPTFTKGPDQNVPEDAAPQTLAGWATGISPGPPNEAAQALFFDITGNTNPPLFSAGPTVSPDGTLTYTPAPDANGSATISVTLRDGGGTENGGVDSSIAETFAITVTAVNDAPAFVRGSNQTVLEDSGPRMVTAWATGISAGSVDESSQTLAFLVTGNTNPALFSSGPAITPLGDLTFAPAPETFGTATITLLLRDSGGTSGGGLDTSVPQTFDITVTGVNDAPTFTKGPDQNVPEDAEPQTIAGWATGISPGPPNEAAQALFFDITGNSNPSLFSAGPTVSPDGTLIFTPAPDANGSAAISVTLRDDGGTDNGGSAASLEQTFTIAVAAVNDAPVIHVPAQITAYEDTLFKLTGVHITDVDVGTATMWFSIMPGFSNGVGGLHQALELINLNIANSTIRPAADYFGPMVVKLSANDEGHSGAGGSKWHSVDVAVQILPVNDAPSFTAGADVHALEDASYSAPWATAISAGPGEDADQTVSFSVVSNSDLSLFAFQPSITPEGVLLFTPAPNRAGSAEVTVVLRDNGGTADGGVDTSGPVTFTIVVASVNDAPSFIAGADVSVPQDSGPHSAPWSTGISAGPNESAQAVHFEITGNTNPSLFSAGPAVGPTGILTFTPAAGVAGSAQITVRLRDDGGTTNGGVDASAAATFSITVFALNQPPSFTVGPNQTVVEDGGAVSVSPWATEISPGPGESGQSVTFEITGNTNPALFSAGPAVSPTGTLTFMPAADAYGVATITLRARDDGGALYGGVDVSPTATFTISVSAVNDAPVIVGPESFTANEDTLFSLAGVRIEDVDVGTAWMSFSVSPAFSDGLGALNQILSVINSTIDNGTFEPAANLFGPMVINMSANDMGNSGAGGAKSVSKSIVVDVLPVNDAPSFTPGANVTVGEDSAAYSAAWATGMSGGPANESGQLLQFEITNSKPALFSAGPTVDPSTGFLRFTPAPDANGVATLTVLVRDDGGTDRGGVDASASSTFSITITPLDDLPSISAPDELMVLEDGFVKLVPIVLSDPDAAYDPNLTWRLYFGSTNGYLVPAYGHLAHLNVLNWILAQNPKSFHPTSDFFGDATVTVFLQEGNSTSNPTVNKTITIHVTPVNDAPSFSPGGTVTFGEGRGAYSAAWATAISAGPNEAGQTLAFTVSGNTNPALFAVQPSLTSAGVLSFTTAPAGSGTATITVVLKDNGGVENGGIDTSPPVSFDIVIVDVNDPPSFTKGSDQIVLEDAGPQTIAGWATAVSPGPPNEAAQSVAFEITGNTNPSLFAAAPAVSPAGTLTFTPTLNAFGTATITLRAKDNGGTAFGGVDTSPSQAFVITVTSVNDAPLITVPPAPVTVAQSGEVAISSSVTDPDCPLTSPMTVSMTLSPAGSTVWFNGAWQSSYSGSLQHSTTKTALNALRFRPPNGYTGSASVGIIINDQGASGLGGPLEDVKTISITVAP